MPDPTLRPGDTGPDVQHAQELLNREGALLTPDGQFGPATAGALRTCQLRHGVPAADTIDPATWTLLRSLPEPCPGIDTRAVTFIAREEVSSRAFYDSHCARPTWPGGESGITIGVGYDLRFADDLLPDWGTLLPATALDVLRPWLRRQGSGEAAASLAAVTVPWPAAWAVFVQRTLPATLRPTDAAFPGADQLPPLCRGALVSLIYNRGPAMEGDRRREMRQIRDALAAGIPAAVPACIRAMQVLWAPGSGLRTRREREAALFEQGLQEAD